MPDDSTLIPSDIISENAHEGIKSLLNSLEQLSKQNINLGPTIKVIETLALEFRSAGASIEQVKGVIKDLTSTFNTSKTALSSYAEAMRMIKENSNKSIKVEKDLANTVKNTMTSMFGLSGAIKDSIKATEEAYGAEDIRTQKIVRQFKAMEDSIKVHKAAAIAKKESAVLEAKIERAMESNTDAIKRQGKAMSALGSDMNGLIAGFGGTTISLKGAVGSILKYDQSIFDLKRTYQTFGVSSKDMSSAFRDVSDNTTFSKQEFADFANEVSSGYSSMNPTVSQIGNFAELLQNQFGPSVAIAKENAKDLLGVFDKYPPAMEAMMGVADLMKAAEKGGDDGASEKQLKDTQALLLAQAEYSGATIEQRKKILQLTTKVDEAEKKGIETAFAAANVKKESADTLLELGNSLKPSIKLVAKSLETVLGYANKLPNVLLLSVGAFGAIGAIMQSKLLGSLKIIPGKFDVLISKLIDIKTIANDAAGSVGGIGNAATRSASGLGSAERGTKSTKGTESVVSDTSERHEAARELMENELERRRDISASKESAAAVKGGGKDAEKALGKGAKKVAQAAQTPSRNAGGSGGSGGRFGNIRNNVASSKKAMGAGAITAVLAGVMVRQQVKSSSEEKGYSEEKSTGRANRSGGIVAASTIAGGLVGMLAGPPGVMIGTTIGGMIGTAFADKVNEDEDVAKSKKDAKAAKAAAAAAKKEADAVEKANKHAGALSKNWSAIKSTHEANMKLLTAQKDVLMQQADIMNDLFGLSADQAEQAYGKAFDAIGTKYAEANSYMATLTSNRGQSTLLDVLDIKKEKIGSDIKKLISALNDPLKDRENQQLELRLEIAGAEKAGLTVDKIAEKQRELNRITLEHKLGTELQTDAIKAQKAPMDAVKESAIGLSKVTFGRLDKELELNSAIEGRLNIERELMEAANFGMGASVKLMQAQVNLSYENIKANQLSLKSQDENVASKMSQVVWTQVEGKENAKNIKDIIKRNFHERKGLKSGAEITANMEDLNRQLADANVKETQRDLIQLRLNQGVKDYNKYQTNSMQAQKKIYDLTKDIREGYLDAVRELVSGAGEFEKIIGTHDMGVTQLMDAVKNTTGENRLNTFALGGYTKTGGERTEEEKRAAAARGGDFGRHTTYGLDLGPMGDVAAMNTDIHEQEKYEEKFKNEGKGKAATPTAGTDIQVKTHELALNAAREDGLAAEKQTAAIIAVKEGAANSVKEGIIAAAARINPDVIKGNAPGQSPQTLETAIRNGASFGGKVLSGAEGGPTATQAHSRAPGPLPVPAGVKGTKGTKGTAGVSGGAAGTQGRNIGFTGVSDFVQEKLAKDQQIIELKKVYKATNEIIRVLEKLDGKEEGYYKKQVKEKESLRKRLNERARIVQQGLGTAVSDAGGTTHYNANQDLFFSNKKVQKERETAATAASAIPVVPTTAPTTAPTTDDGEPPDFFAGGEKRRPVNFDTSNLIPGLPTLMGDTLKNMWSGISRTNDEVSYASGLIGSEAYNERNTERDAKDHTNVKDVERHQLFEKQRLKLLEDPSVTKKETIEHDLSGGFDVFRETVKNALGVIEKHGLLKSIGQSGLDEDPQQNLPGNGINNYTHPSLEKTRLDIQERKKSRLRKEWFEKMEEYYKQQGASGAPTAGVSAPGYSDLANVSTPLRERDSVIQHNINSKQANKVSSAAIQADFNSTDSDLARNLQGYGPVAGSDGLVSGEITINLGDGLLAQIDRASGLAISLS